MLWSMETICHIFLKNLVLGLKNLVFQLKNLIKKPSIWIEGHRIQPCFSNIKQKKLLF